MIIALATTHPASRQLSGLAAVLRAQKRNEETAAPPELCRAINLTETGHGNSTATYLLLPGRATPDEAIHSYQYLRKFYPAVLDLLCHAAAQEQIEVTIEVGTLAREDMLTYSQHDLLKIMPRILSLFRGTLRKS